MNYQFGEFQLDTINGKLVKNGGILCDDLKTVKLLDGLCSAYPDVADKQVLIDSIWPDQVVSDWSLSRLVSDVRQLMEDSGKDQGYIKTVRGRGFKLNVQVEEIETVSVDAMTAKSAASLSHPRLKSSNRGTKRVGSVIGVVLIAVIYFLFDMTQTDKPESDKAFVDSNDGLLRIAVMPTEIESTGHTDDWVKYGIMSIVSNQLAQYPSLQTIPSSNVIAVHASLQEKLKGADGDTENRLFETVCGQLGCTHLVTLAYRFEDNQPYLSYQIYDQNRRSGISEFLQTDIIETTDMLLDFLASDLIPERKIQLSLQETYSQNSRANRDYAIGVNDLHLGDVNSAINYLNLAIEKVDNFTWAKIYLADATYRSSDLEGAISMVRKLKQNSLDDNQAYEIAHLESNILYSQGKLNDSLAVTEELLASPMALQEPLRRGNQLLNLGSSYQALGQLEKASDYLNKALAAYQEASFGPGEGKALYNLGNVELTYNQPQKALEYYQHAREVFKRYAMTGYDLMAKHQVATTNLSIGQYQNAESELKMLIKAYQKIGDTYGELMAQLDLAIASSKKQNFQEGLIRATSLLDTIPETGYENIKNHASAIAAYSSIKLNQLPKAKNYLAMIGGEWNDPRPNFSLLEAYYFHQSGQVDKAVRMAQEIKTNLKSQWSDKHQLVLDEFLRSQSTGELQTITL